MLACTSTPLRLSQALRLLGRYTSQISNHSVGTAHSIRPKPTPDNRTHSRRRGTRSNHRKGQRRLAPTRSVERRKPKRPRSLVALRRRNLEGRILRPTSRTRRNHPLPHRIPQSKRALRVVPLRKQRRTACLENFAQTQTIIPKEHRTWLVEPQ